jgi:hypothetical protein
MGKSQCFIGFFLIDGARYMFLQVRKQFAWSLKGHIYVNSELVQCYMSIPSVIDHTLRDLLLYLFRFVCPWPHEKNA